MKKEIAEFIGTFALVLFGCGAAVVAGGGLGVLGVALAFGLILMAMFYGIGPVSGCHVNPAVSFGAYVAGQMDMGEMIRYIVAQCLGAIVGAFVLMAIVKGQLSGYDVAGSGLAHNGWGADMGGFGLQSAFIFEFIATAVLVLVVLGATKKDGAGHVSGLAIGLTLAVIYMVGINITGGSVNPARSLGPALFVGGDAISQLWLFIVAPLAGGLLGGVLYKMGWLDK